MSRDDMHLPNDPGPSDTPRTDAVYMESQRVPEVPSDPWDLARTLERELADAKTAEALATRMMTEQRERDASYAEQSRSALRAMLADLPELWGDHVIEGQIALTIKVDADVIEQALAALAAAPSVAQRETNTREQEGERRGVRLAASPGPITGNEPGEGSQQLQTGVTGRRDGQPSKDEYAIGSVGPFTVGHHPQHPECDVSYVLDASRQEICTIYLDDSNGMAERIAAALNAASEACPATGSVSGWLPVGGEHRPGPRDWCAIVYPLCYGEPERGFGTAIAREYRRGEWETNEDKRRYFCGVTHYMPLPPLPHLPAQNSSTEGDRGKA